MILKILPKLLLTFACFVVILILSLCMNTFYWADDYALINNLNKLGVVQHCIEGYLTWDGRMLSLGGFVQCILLKYLPIQLITFVWSLCFLGSGILIYSIINQEFRFQITNKRRTICSIIS